MNKKGSILMISLWILAILVVFALGLGHRAAINLRLAKYQRDRLKATCLAKAGINRAIAEIKIDDPSVDSLNDKWANNEDAFKDILSNEDKDKNEEKTEFATVSYFKDKKEAIYGVRDEERKININKTNDTCQKWLFVHAGLSETEVEQLQGIIANWIDSDTELQDAEKEFFKNTELKTPEELLLILEYFYEMNGKDRKDAQDESSKIYDKVKDLITIYGGEKVNVNTVSEEVLTILAKSVAGDEDQKNCTPTVASEIIKIRDDKIRNNQPLKSIEEIDIKATKIEQTNTPCVTLFDNLKNNYLIFKSDYFKIEATGKVGQVTKNITAIYDRSGEGKIVSWHEN